MIPGAEWGTINKMEADHPPLMICEYLVAKSAGKPPEDFPSRANRCTAGGRLEKLSFEQQAEVCLGPAHARCPLRLKALAAQFAPPLGAAEALPASEYAPPELGSAKRPKKQPESKEEAPEVPTGEELLLADFEDIHEPEASEEQEPIPADQEPPSQPFRRDMEDWMRGLFKEKNDE